MKICQLNLRMGWGMCWVGNRFVAWRINVDSLMFAYICQSNVNPDQNLSSKLKFVLKSVTKPKVGWEVKNVEKSTLDKKSNWTNEASNFQQLIEVKVHEMNTFKQNTNQEKRTMIEARQKQFSFQLIFLF